MDPRGVGQSSPAIDCKANQKTDGIYSQPVTTPDNLDVSALIAKDQRYIKRCIELNDGILAHVSTANVARDIDLLRQSLGEQKITYFGYSYGTFLGSTYASMFPTHYRAMVLDGPVDADAYINDPMRDLSAQTSGLRARARALLPGVRGRSRRVPRLPGGGSDPWDAYDALIEKVNANPMPVGDATRSTVTTSRPAQRPRSTARPTGRSWPRRSPMPQNGDGSLMKALSDSFYGDNGDGTFDPGGDRYFTIGATEQQYPRDVRTLPVGRPALVGPARALLVEQRLRRAQLRPLPGPRQRRVRRPVQGAGLVGRRRSWSARRTTRPRPTAARRTSSARWATPAC